MGDLISRSALLEALKASREHHAETSRDLSLLCRCENIVREQPIAYNVDKVVEQLKANSKTMMPVIPTEKAIEIVKAGGVE